ncbi:MAG TPA: carboxypeptidase-like regulatory domain-containing protein [Candidatus Angelobacter sp.]|nr:carboxypeptidase-like regulatory domain-containing protein [Candidatus Angelobacter sp.]
MKTISAIVLSLVCCTPAVGDCRTGEAKSLHSYDKVRIAVFLGGKAQPNVMLDIIGAARLSTSTKAGGVAELPLLPPGDYWIVSQVASRAAELCLRVEMSSKGETSSFSMDLVPNQRIAGEAIQEFRGTLVDANDARIAGAKIELFKMGSLQAAPVLQAESQQDGVFSGLLPEGQYLAIFTKFGFRPVAMIFEIAKNEKARDLRIAMQVQSMSATQVQTQGCSPKLVYIKNWNEKLA